MHSTPIGPTGAAIENPINTPFSQHASIRPPTVAARQGCAGRLAQQSAPTGRRPATGNRQLSTVYCTSEVQFGQRTASMEIVLKQYGHSLVVGGPAGAGLACRRLICLISRKITRATMTKSIRLLMNAP